MVFSFFLATNSTIKPAVIRQVETKLYIKNRRIRSKNGVIKLHQQKKQNVPLR